MALPECLGMDFSLVPPDVVRNLYVFIADATCSIGLDFPNSLYEGLASGLPFSSRVGFNFV
jgi:hypothetical protein